METSEKPILYRRINPPVQAVIVFGAALVITLITSLINFSGLVEISPRFHWMTAASFLLFFALFNSIFSLSSHNYNKYWNKSIISFIGLAAVSAGMAWLFSSIPIMEAGSYSWIFIVVTVAYIVFMSITGLTKFIVEFAEKEVWLHPRKRNRDKKKD